MSLMMFSSDSPLSCTASANSRWSAVSGVFNNRPVMPVTLFMDMQIGCPPVATQPDLLVLVLEQRLDATVPPHGICVEFPVPHRLVGGAGHDAKSQFTFLKRVLGAFARGQLLGQLASERARLA